MKILKPWQNAAWVFLFSISALLNNAPVSLAAGGHDKHDQIETEQLHDDHEAKTKGSHDEHGEPDDHQEGVVTLSLKQMMAANIKVEQLQFKIVPSVINAPAEVTFNTYETSSITPSISARVIRPHVVLGEHVETGQPIITLSSVEMADAQGNLLLTDREWKRVKKLGRKLVSESRYTEAKINWELAKAKVKAYGMTDKQMNELLISKDFSRANGLFELVATHNGTILKEDYIQGQQVEAGHELIRITNETNLWVIAKVSPTVAHLISIGNKATVSFGKHVLAAKVIQRSHSLDKMTRTSGVRLAVRNKNELLHPGMFVDTQIETTTKSKALTLPESAVLRSADGDWQVMVQQENEGEFKAVEVELLRVSNNQALISGLEAGTSVVTQGAFFIQSELAKSGFDIHNH